MLHKKVSDDFLRAKDDITSFNASKLYEQLSKIGTKKASIDFISRKFETLLKELRNDPSIDRFKKEYESLLQLVYYSFQAQQKLIGNNAGQVKRALQSSYKDASTILALEKEVDRAWQIVDSTKQREGEMSKTANNLKIEVEKSKNASMTQRPQQRINAQDNESSYPKLTKYKQEIAHLQRALKYSEQCRAKEEQKNKQLQYKLLSTPSIKVKNNRSLSTSQIRSQTDVAGQKNRQIAQQKQQIKQLNQKLKQQQNLYEAVRADRNLYSKNLVQAQDQVTQLRRQLKEAKKEITNQKKQKAQFNEKLKEQKNLYEAVRADRNLYSKNLVQAQSELDYYKLNSKKFSHQITSLKDEIKHKDGELNTKQIQNQRFQKIVDQTRNSYDQLRRHSDKQKDQLNTSKRDISKLNHCLDSAERQLKKQKRVYEGVINKMWM